MKKIILFTVFLFYIVTEGITIRAYAEEQDVLVTTPKVPTQVDVTIKGTPNVNVVNTPLQVEVANEDIK